jgi:hypothetical protein
MLNQAEEEIENLLQKSMWFKPVAEEYVVQTSGRRPVKPLAEDWVSKSVLAE